jgi:hypothetical protein
VFAPTDAEIREDRELMERISAATAMLNGPGRRTAGG